MKIDPARTAVLAMDFQPSILMTLADPESVIENAVRVVAAMRAWGGKVAYARVAFTLEELAAFPPYSAMGQRMNAAGGKVLVDAPTTRIDERLAPRVGDILVRKRRVGPFSTTDLHLQLKASGVDTLILCGVHTSGCVLSSVREAHDLDYRLVVAADGCADPDPSVHEFLIEKIFPKQANVLAVADVVALLEGLSAG